MQISKLKKSKYKIQRKSFIPLISDWLVGNEIAVATTDFEHRHTEYFKIISKTGNSLTLNTTLNWEHLGLSDSTTTYNKKSVHQAAEVALLTRNIVIDGSGGSNHKTGGRILISSQVKEIGHHNYTRSGFAQFSNVEFKGMGQHGYTSYNDYRYEFNVFKIFVIKPVRSLPIAY